jgi:RpiR family carbohydrate utilization transcriptional regulator
LTERNLNQPDFRRLLARSNRSAGICMPTKREPKHLHFQSAVTLQLHELSETRQQVIRPVLESPREFVLLNVRDMARRLSTGPATIVRIVQALGFESYKDFQHYLHDLSITSSTILDSMQAAGNTTQTPKFLRDSKRLIQQNLDFILDRVDLQQVLNIAVRIHEAKRILLLGGDMAAPLVDYMEYHLTIAGLPVYAATSPGRATHLARSTSSDDIVIGISFRRGLRMTIEGIQKARGNGAYCIGVTDSPLSPLARFSDELVIVPINSLSFAASYVAPIALIDLITAGVGSLRRKQVVDRLKEADQEQKHGYRWYQTES